jgi:hypothetical protein
MLRESQVNLQVKRSCHLSGYGSGPECSPASGTSSPRTSSFLAAGLLVSISGMGLARSLPSGFLRGALDLAVCRILSSSTSTVFLNDTACPSLVA